MYAIFQGCVGTPLPGTEVRIVTENMDRKREVVLQRQRHI